MVPGNHLLILRHEILLEQNYILNQVIENPSLEIPHNAGIGILALGSLSYFMYYNKGLRMHVSMFLWILSWIPILYVILKKKLK